MTDPAIMSKRHLLVAVLMLPSLHATLSAQSTQRIRRLDGSTISVATADSLARSALAEARVTGAQIALLDQGKLVWGAAYGLRHKDPDEPMDRNTTTWAASITKSVFATYVMQLVERGEFNLDTPIAQQLGKPLNEFEPYRLTASDIVSDSNWRRVTPRMLMSHTSGLANFALLEPDKKMHLNTVPGARYRYSGEGINLVQFVIEQQKGRGLAELMQEAIFAPLGMLHTGMVHRKDFEANVSDRFDLDEKFHAQTRRGPARGAGSMASTADDLASFATALFDGRIIKPATLTAMLAPQIQIRSVHQFGGPNEGEGREAADVGLAYGIGWGLLTKTPFGPAFFKEGHGDGAQTYMICFQQRKACMIILTNNDNGELAFRSLLEGIMGNTATPWEWEGYTQAYIKASRSNP